MTSQFGANRSESGRWEQHRVLAACLRATVIAVPWALAMVVGVVTAWAVPGTSVAGDVARVVVSGMASILGFALFEWAGRHLLPLAVLLRLALVFPDRAPSRFAVALRSTSVRRLQLWARSAGDEDDTAALAEKVVTLASALNFHDRRSRGHSERTRAITELFIDELELPVDEANGVRWGAFLHDIGKLVVPAELLNKPGAPTADEWEDLRRHPAEGGRIVAPLRPFLGSGVDAVAFHHESYDGTGYPAGLRGDAIPFAARIVAVADSFEVMTAVRSYKRPMSAAAARAELVRESGKQFDPVVVRAFLNVSLGRLHWALGLAAWLAELPFVSFLPRAAAQVTTAVGAGGSSLSTATLTSVATASLGATLAANPLVGHALPPSAPVAHPSGIVTTAQSSAAASSSRHAGSVVSRSHRAGSSRPGANAASNVSASSVAAVPGRARTQSSANDGGSPSGGTSESAANRGEGTGPVARAASAGSPPANGDGNGNGNPVGRPTVVPAAAGSVTGAVSGATGSVTGAVSGAAAAVAGAVSGADGSAATSAPGAATTPGLGVTGSAPPGTVGPGPTPGRGVGTAMARSAIGAVGGRP